VTIVLALIALVGSAALAGVWLVGQLASNRSALRLGSARSGSEAIEARLVAALAEDGAGRVSAGRVSGALGVSTTVFVVSTGGLGLAVAGVCRMVFGFSFLIAGAIGLDAAILLGLVLATWGERRALRLEEQLAQLLRLTAAGLRAGMGRIDALGRSAAQVGDPLGGVLRETVGRLRLGEEADRAFAHLAQQVPLESFRLFSVVIATQWHAGGSLQNTLGSIGEFMQDRVDVACRIQAQSSPTRSSVLTLIAATAAIAYFSHANDPANLERFLRSTWGDRLIAAALTLQGGALVWIWRLTRTRL
jgi:Flp pilus assembly protein TadB